jgi:hypothetical protein
MIFVQEIFFLISASTLFTFIKNYLDFPQVFQDKAEILTSIKPQPFLSHSVKDQ